MHQLVEAIVAFENLGIKFHVQQRAAGAGVVHLGGGLEDAVGPWRSAPWTGEMPSDNGTPALRPSGVAPDDRAEVHVDRGRQQVDAVAAALGLGPAVHRLEVRLEHRPHHVVGVVIVVAVLGRPLKQRLLELLVALEIRLQRGQQLLPWRRSCARRRGT